ncbi:MAG: 30S ribosomal protein S19e [Candidatus Woesearchaeota archaeon]
MVSVYSVDPSALIRRVSEELKKTDLVHPPLWAKFVKTGPAKDRPPVEDDWWYVRASSVLRAVYKEGPIGVGKLRTRYGSKQNRGLAPERFRPASGNILRTILQQLEKEGLLMQGKDKNERGRHITSKGQSLLEKCASELHKTNDTGATEESKTASKTKEKQSPKKEKKTSKDLDKKGDKTENKKEDKSTSDKKTASDHKKSKSGQSEKKKVDEKPAAEKKDKSDDDNKSKVKA